MRFDKLFFERAMADWREMSQDVWLEIVKNKLQTSLGFERLEEFCKNNKVLNVKFGIDPTGSNIHIGHVVPMMLVNAFLKKGHNVNIVIGDFTAKIGDPSGRNVERKALSFEQIQKNMSTYKQQMGMFVNMDSAHVRYNSEWLDKLNPVELFSAFQTINVSQAMQRDDFRKRMENGSAVTLAELCYSVLMGLDSVALTCDVEVGGIDQLLNFQQCRDIMKARGMKEEIALTTPILEGTSGDGRKMSKSYGNAIAVLEPIDEKFGKLMSITDAQIMQYFSCFAFMTDSEKEELEHFVSKNPFEAKKQLATYFVALETKDLSVAEKIRSDFERKFSKGTIKAEDCEDVKLEDGETWFDVIAKLNLMSKSQLRRMFTGNAIRQTTKDGSKGELCKMDEFAKKGIIRIGKKLFVNII